MRCVVWRMSLNGVVSSRSSLARHGVLGVQVPIEYAFCGVMEESIEHMLFSCTS
ncbi:hypothetical protein Lalb_Chr05g0225661 [Lupinus albus]|uniref:Uncharacterized protein n=1 Tax=Lupinus albus TaxID=3870 RepID=A0A6A4QJW2_LUPAL|nr:hypothetical protein Lalb_Chr05g0225661 [Lupinus albus]